MISYLLHKLYFKLNKNRIKNKSIFSYEGLKTYCKVSDIYDGDTFRISFRYHGKIIKLKCRAYGYDSPEMKPSLKQENREEEKKIAIETKEYLISILEKNNFIIYAEFLNFDKYGRVLIKFFTPNPINRICINDLMIKETPSKPYLGGHKESHV